MQRKYNYRYFPKFRPIYAADLFYLVYMFDQFHKVLPLDLSFTQLSLRIFLNRKITYHNKHN